MVVLSTYRSWGRVEPMTGLPVKLGTVRAEVRVCASRDCAELLARRSRGEGGLGNVGVPLVAIGVWR